MATEKPIRIVNVIRRMRGGSQSFLVRASDGLYYVAKFRENPQGNRTLINEMIANQLLRCIGVGVPDLAILHLDQSCKDYDQLYFSTGSGPKLVSTGLHLGSRCPVDPDKSAIFDFLPTKLYPMVMNLEDLGVTFAFDQWVAHTDSRQAIFARPRVVPQHRCIKDTKGALLRCWIIDNGMCFGKDWKIKEQLFYGYPTNLINGYRHFNLRDSARRGAYRIKSLTSAELDDARRRVPQEWFAPEDATALEAMLDVLHARQSGLVARVYSHVESFRCFSN